MGCIERCVRRLMIDVASRPRRCTNACPQTCKRQSPRQDRFQVSVRQARVRLSKTACERTADGSEAQKPTSTRPRFAIAFSLTLTQNGRGESIRRKPIGSGGSVRKACGPGDAEMQIHPSAGVNLRRDEPQERRRTKREGPIVRPGRERPRGRVAERRARDHVGA
jgi:hypothetical protein